MTDLFAAPLDRTIDIAYGMLALALTLSFFRLARGPALGDRVIALDVIGSISVGIIAVTAIETRQGALIDIALALAVVSFLATVGFARYLERMGRDD